MDKKRLSETQFNDYIDSETIAFYVYDFIIRKKYTDEYVDVLGNTFCSYCGELDSKIPNFYSAKCILEKDYNVDMLSLPFRNESNKLKIMRYGLVQQLEDYFKENKIKYKPNKAFFKGQELSSIDPNVEHIMDQINDIDLDLINLDSKNIDI